MGALALRGFDAKAVGKAKIAPYVFLPAPRSVEYSGKCVPRGKEVKKTVSIDPKTVTQEQGYRHWLFQPGRLKSSPMIKQVHSMH